MSNRQIINQRIVLASRPQGEVTAANFRLESVEAATPSEGQVLVRNHFMSLDPYMRGRMDDVKSYAQPQALNEVMQAGTVGEVLESHSPLLQVGDKVVGMLGWQHFGVADAKLLRKLDAAIPLSTYLGCVGMPGVTAWRGLNEIIAPKPGETVVVSAASGAVGGVVGQLAKAKGCSVIGVAGGVQKCKVVTEEFGFDACIDYKAAGWQEAFKAATAKGIDGYFDNVGGEVLDAVLARMNAFGRIAVCGLISGYNGNPMAVNNFRSVLVNRLTVQGFIVSEKPEVWPQALRELGHAVATGKLRYRETVAQGLEQAPAAFMGMLKGQNLGKQLVKLL